VLMQLEDLTRRLLHSPTKLVDGPAAPIAAAAGQGGRR
jgi:hypothetical protein